MAEKIIFQQWIKTKQNWKQSFFGNAKEVEEIKEYIKTVSNYDWTSLSRVTVSFLVIADRLNFELTAR